MSKLKEKYKHFVWGENKICFPEYEYIIKLDYPRLYIRYKVADGYFTDYDQFYNSIAEVQWLDGYKPEQNQVNSILTDAWNYLAIEERLLEQDLISLEKELENDDIF